MAAPTTRDLATNLGFNARYIQTATGIYVPGTASILLGTQTNPGDTLVVVDSNGAVRVNQGQLDSAQDSVNLASTRASYISVGSLTPDATTTSEDFLTLAGVAATFVRLIRFRIWPRVTTAAWMTFALTRRSTLDSGGTSTNPSYAQVLSSDPAGSAKIYAYTAKPTNGVTAGSVGRTTLVVPSTTALAGLEPICVDWNWTKSGLKIPTLASGSEMIGLNCQSTYQAGLVLDWEIWWTEATS